MILSSVSVSSVEKEKSLGLRFQSGSGKFSRIYFMTGGQQQFNHFAASMDYAAFGLDPEKKFVNASVRMSDADGKIWEVLRKYDQRFVLNQSRNVNIPAEDLFIPEVRAEGLPEPKKMLGRYQLSLRNRDLFMSSLNLTKESDQITYRFLQENTRSLLNSCALSFDHPGFGKPEYLDKLMKELEPVYWEWRGLSSGLSRAGEGGVSPPEDCRKSLKTLKEQVNLLHRADDLLQKLNNPRDGIETLRRRLLKCEKEIQTELNSCGLKEFCEKKVLIDWNIPLQCLCYLNVLDQLIPALQMSLKQLKSFFKKTLNGLLQQSGPVYSNIRDLTGMLDQHRRELISLLETSKMALRSAEEEGNTFWNKVTFQKERSRHVEAGIDQVVNEVRRSLGDFDNLLLNFRKVRLQPSEVEPLTLPLEEFLEQTRAKKEALARHWKTLCDELDVSESVCLHDFLQYIMKINGLIIQRQKAAGLKEQLTSRKGDLLKLKELIVSWYDLTGSQKAVCLTNSQMILNEAKNVVRYLEEKERRVKFLQENQLSIELCSRERAALVERKQQTLQKWQETFSKLGLPVAGPDDERFPQLIEKHKILKSLNFLQSHISGLNLIPAFTRDWEYECICIWKLSSLLQDELQSSDLIRKAQDLPEESHHVIFIRDSELAAPLRRAGFGHVTPFWKPEETRGSGAESKGRKKTVQRKMIVPSAQRARDSSPPAAGKNKPGEELSPQIQAVVELLNGDFSRQR